MDIPGEPMTIVGVMTDRHRSPIVLRSRHTHYIHAVDEMISQVEEEFEDDADGNEFLMADMAGDSFESIKVYAGHPPGETDDVSGLQLLHEE
jgi:hypothetical protein